MRLCELKPECLKMELAMNIKFTSDIQTIQIKHKNKRERKEWNIIYMFTFYLPTATSQRNETAAVSLLQCSR
jgi:hypothetical protein